MLFLCVAPGPDGAEVHEELVSPTDETPKKNNKKNDAKDKKKIPKVQTPKKNVAPVVISPAFDEGEIGSVKGIEDGDGVYDVATMLG